MVNSSPPLPVSIVIPTWNRAHTLGRAIESALAQSCPAAEIVVSDNASTDGTADLVADYSRRDHRIKYLRAEANTGPVNNWRRGIEAARGPLIKVLFSDDRLDPQFLELTASLWDLDHPPRFAYTRFGPAEGGATVHAGPPSLIRERPWVFLRKSLITHGDVPVSLSAGLFLKEDLLAAWGPRILAPAGHSFDFLGTGVGYDQAVFLHAAHQAEWVAQLPAKLVYFGGQADSISIRTNRAKPGSLIRAYLWAQLFFVLHAYADRPMTRTFLLTCIHAQLLKHNVRHHPWVMSWLPAPT